MPKNNSKSRKIKISEKTKRIRKSGNELKLSEEDWIYAFKRHCINKYRVIDDELAMFSTELSNWRIEHDGCVVTLWHESKDFAVHGNDRSSYHVQNVFYDIDYCIRSAKEHDEFEAKVRYG